MNTLLKKIKLLVTDRNLRNRILAIVGFLVLFRLLAAIPVPGVDVTRLQQFLANNQFFGILNVLSGGGLSNLSIIMLGVSPYITASIIMQLLTILSPRIKSAYQDNGDAGRQKFAQYGRILTVPMALLQGFGFLLLLKKQGIIVELSTFGFALNLAVIVAGSVLLMWIGELLSEFGIGNGVSLLIFAGIVAQLPTHIAQAIYSFDISQLPVFLLFAALGALIIAFVVFVNDAERQIPVTYARQVHGNRVIGGTSTYIPVRLNQAGVMPIIFALSILLFPQLIANVFANSTHSVLASLAHAMSWFVTSAWAYPLVYFIFVVLFTYFYTAVTFDPEQMSQNLQKSGAFIPGIRPGEATMKYLSYIIVRLTLFGALFLGLIAVIPLVLKSATGITSLTVGGTSLLIAVSVVIDLVKRIEAQLSLREY
ncbi:MAG: preprotein translocase subunit SecY [bacterium]